MATTSREVPARAEMDRSWGFQLFLGFDVSSCWGFWGFGVLRFGILGCPRGLLG